MMTSTIDISSIGKPPHTGPRGKRRHVRSLTGKSSRPYERYCSESPPFHIGDFPEVDEKGQEKWPKGDEKAWKAALRDINSSELNLFLPFTLPS
jgi:glycogen phosphorylase